MMQSNVCLETRWGLGLQNVEDMPPQNLYYFGLVSNPPRFVLALLKYSSSLMLHHHCMHHLKYQLIILLNSLLQLHLCYSRI
jgi:hypothetical protein